ncbi:putative ParB-like nuclease [Reticulomyxa filosa]|uniref:Putative ParB-like nuclease n=1 Tax=Reticulomyxa filosa TaxID=46433 RepID=X6P0I4_RETFI|nr:putative ParB-like nuclease [Reticulomyxa filosa]|eukprot:ETO31589.1 putative ParB-like nuclease [Reticulomyxa filosa]
MFYENCFHKNINVSFFFKTNPIKKGFKMIDTLKSILENFLKTFGQKKVQENHVKKLLSVMMRALVTFLVFAFHCLLSNASSGASPFPFHKNHLNNTQVTPLVQCAQVDLDYTSKESWCNVVIPKLLSQYGYVPMGSACIANARDLLPTQSAIGYSLLNCKTEIIQSKFLHGSQWLVNYLLDNPGRLLVIQWNTHAYTKKKKNNKAPAIIAPSWGHEWDIYLTDHHHLARAIIDAFPGDTRFSNYRWLKICVIEDLRMLSQSEFWAYLVNNGYAWLEDRHGESMSWYDLPNNMQSLTDDPFRSLSEYIRDAHGYIKCVDNKPFFEFYWADFFRRHLTQHDRDFQEFVNKIITFAFFLLEHPFLRRLYDMDWSHQVEIFNDNFGTIMKLALSSEAFDDSDLEGQNVDRSHVYVMEVNQSTGCDSLYGQLIIPKDGSTPQHIELSAGLYNTYGPSYPHHRPPSKKSAVVAISFVVVLAVMLAIAVARGCIIQQLKRLFNYKKIASTRHTMGPSTVSQYVSSQTGRLLTKRVPKEIIRLFNMHNIYESRIACFS